MCDAAFSLRVVDRLRLRYMKMPRATARITPKATPTPIPAFAPVEMPEEAAVDVATDPEAVADAGERLCAPV